MNLRAHKVDDFAITEGGSAPHCGSEGGSAKPVTEVVYKDANALRVCGFER
jgi:hypothetical protein